MLQWSLIALLINSCASLYEVYSRPELVRQILRPYRGKEPKLVNSSCVKYNALGNCVDMSLAEYDINDDSVRNTLIKLNFICIVGGKMYRFAEKAPGLVREEYRETFFGNRKQIYHDYIPILEYDFLISAGTECFKSE